jgi:tetratricopeptide (TPR) repeat protein
MWGRVAAWIVMAAVVPWSGCEAPLETPDTMAFPEATTDEVAAVERVPVETAPIDVAPVKAELAEAAAIYTEGPFCLTTEFQPADDEGYSQNPLFRELGRQAILIAARDGLGLMTRDETLGETFPEDATARRGPFALEVRAKTSGEGYLSLTLAEPTDPKAADMELVRHELKFQGSAYDRYASLARALEPALRGELVDRLRAAGLQGNAVPDNPGGQLADDIEPLLAEMSFVSQYAAVRQIHHAIAEHGESPARLGGLVRGYANLTMLSRHHWNSAHTVFTARALLYAERMAALDNTGRSSQQHRAYARAIVGMHGLALQDLKDLPAASGDENDPSWTLVAEPFCRFKYDELLKLADEPRLKQLAHRLAFESKSYYFDSRWNVAASRAAVENCRDAYGVYSYLATKSAILIERQSVSYAAEVLGGRLPKSVHGVAGLPGPVAEFLRKETQPKRPSILGIPIPGGGQQSQSGSTVPMETARQLREHVATNGDSAEPSWGVLANLIAEEQFVQLANSFLVSMNAVEYSKKEMVVQLAPLVEGHPYAAYVLSFAVNERQQPTEVKAFAKIIGVRDPRAVMRPMFNRFGTAEDANGRRFSNLRWHAIWERDYLYPELLTSQAIVRTAWWQRSNLISYFLDYSNDLAKVSPHAPTALRMETKTTVRPSDEQLADWESRATGDPKTLSKIAVIYDERENHEAAIRCYKQSYELSPTPDEAMRLAAAYRADGQDEKWLPTLESYLDKEDYSLGHARIHGYIAQAYVEEERYQEAAPHAIAAGQTWSAWGLNLASQVTEALGQWDESEQWVREASNNYPTGSGYHWYFWCRRTGRGDVAAARRRFDEFLKLDWVQKSSGDSDDYVFVDHVLNGRHQEALERIQASNGYPKSIYWQTHGALLAKRMGNDALYASLLGKVMNINDNRNKESAPKMHALIDSMQTISREGSLTDEQFAEVDHLLKEATFADRCNYCYFFGEQLALHGDQERAEQFWRRAVTRGPYQKYAALFSGHRLCELHGTSRPDVVAEPAGDGPADDLTL